MSNFTHFASVLKEFELEVTLYDLSETPKDIISDHTQLLLRNFESYFQKKEDI